MKHKSNRMAMVTTLDRLQSMALFIEISCAPKGHTSGAGVQKSLDFSQVRLSSAQISFVY